MSYIYPSPGIAPQFGYCACPMCMYHQGRQGGQITTAPTTTLTSNYRPRHRKPGPAQ